MFQGGGREPVSCVLALCGPPGGTGRRPGIANTQGITKRFMSL